jgi:hypothetical protein
MPEGRRFQVGTSGNPSGRRRVTDVERAARSLAASLTPDALTFLHDAWCNPRVSWKDRIAAARAVLACGHGDVLRNDPGAIGDLRIVVHTIAIDNAQPVSGVIKSPVAGHVDHRYRLLTGQPSEVIDAPEARKAST